MTVPGNHSPALRPDRDLVAGRETLEVERQFGDASTVGVAAGLQRRDMLGRESMRPE